MSNVVFSKDQLCAVQIETVFGQAPNTTGTATVANTNFCLIESGSFTASPALIKDPSKTGSLDQLQGIPGRRNASWQMKIVLRGSGAAGTAPDAGPFLQALFGKAPTIVAVTSVTYNVDDLSPSLSIYLFRKPGTATQHLAIGAVVNKGSITFGADVAVLEVSGTALWVLDTDQYATADATAKGGLTVAFPAQPSTPAFNGTMVTGFKGTVTIDGVAYTRVRSVKWDFNANREIPNDVIGLGYGTDPVQDRREVMIEIDMYDDDSAALSALKLKAINATPIAFIGVAGTVAGNIWTSNVPRMQLTPATYDDSGKMFAAKFSGTAFASGIQTKDPTTLVLT
jgi:hypothetical protein